MQCNAMQCNAMQCNYVYNVTSKQHARDLVTAIAGILLYIHEFGFRFLGNNQLDTFAEGAFDGLFGLTVL